MAHAHAYSFRVCGIETMLRINSISLQAIAMDDQDSHDPEHDKECGLPTTNIASERQSDRHFNLDYIHGLGVQLRKEMASAGASIDDLIDTQDVEAYLLRKGMVHFDRRRLQIRLDLGGNGSRSTLSTLVVSSQEHMRQLVGVSVCLGDGVG